MRSAAPGVLRLIFSGSLVALLALASSSNAPSAQPATKSVIISATRTVVFHTDLHKKDPANCCTDYRKEDRTVRVSVSLQSQAVRFTDTGSEFQLDESTAGGDGGSKRFDGTGTVTLEEHRDQGQRDCTCTDACASSNLQNGQGRAALDLSESHVAFDYDRDAKHGNFALQFTYGQPAAQGTDRARDCRTSKTSQLGSAYAPAVSGSALDYGVFTGADWSPYDAMNLPADAKAALTKGLNKSGNGGRASISETRQGFEISYDNSVTLDEHDEDPSFDGVETITITTSVHISIGGQPIAYDAILVPTGEVPGTSGDYEAWVPEGPPPGSTAQGARGNAIGFRIKLVDKRRPDVEVKNVDYGVTYKLEKVSHIPGYATNYPKGGSDAGADLTFDPVMGLMPDVAHLSDDSASTTDSGGSSAVAVIRSHDYAAYGTLTATVRLKGNGETIDAHLQSDSKTAVSLPLDRNGNHIADSWEQNEGVLANNYPEKWDGEHVDGNDHDGDGITIFEEYRGFVDGGKYERLSPKVKDVFLINESGMDLTGHFGLFERASQMKVHVAKPDELDRVINPVETEGKGGDQEAIIVKTYEFADPTVLGQMFPEPKNRYSDTGIRSPHDAEFLGVSGTVGADLDYTLAHELAHGLGVKHHGDSVESYDSFFENNVLLSPGRILIDQTGEVLDKRTITNLPAAQRFGMFIGPEDQQHPALAVARAHSPASGDARCIMTYNHDFQLSLPETAPDGKSYIVFIDPKKPMPPDGTIFCRSPKGTSWNDAHHAPVSVFGDAAPDHGDCWSQFRIKTW